MTLAEQSRDAAWVLRRSCVAAIAAWVGSLAGCDAPSTAPGDSPLPPAVPAGKAEAGEAPAPQTRALANWEDEGWTAQPQSDGGVVLGHSHTPLVTVRHVAFGKAWTWGALKVGLGPGRSGSYAIEGRSARLPIRLEGSVRLNGTKITFDYALVVTQPIVAAKGIGLQFEVALDSTAWPARPDVTASPAGDGFDISLRGGDPIRVRTAGSAKTVLERRKPGRVRVFVAQGTIPAGRYPVSITIDTPASTETLPPLATRYGASDHAGWHADTLVWNDWPVDLSWLNDGHRPAGAHGRVRVRGDALEWSDGTPARFWGTNIAAQTLFEGDKDAIAQQAKRIAALGFNLVRLHHHDAGWVARNVFDTRDGTSQTLAVDRLDQLDWWLHCLANEGVYVWLDIHVSRKFLRGDEVPGQAELDRATGGKAKGFAYVNPRIQHLLDRFARQYVGRRNTYRKRTWAEDPAVVAVLVTNENDLTDHFGNLFNADKGLPHHRKLFEAQAASIVADLHLDAKRARELWKPGPAKLLLAELQHRFDTHAIEVLRGAGVKAPIATTSYWGRGKLHALPPLAAGDLIDAHSYGKSESLGTNPRHRSNWLHFIATGAVENKPLSVSEWSVASPASDRFVAPLYIASVASLQGWDALLSFAYSQAPNAEPSRDRSWATSVDPALMALGPAAALMFRRGDVHRARQTVVVAPSIDDVWNRARNAENSAALRTLPEQHRMVLRLPDAPELAWDGAAAVNTDARVVTDLDGDFIGAAERYVESDTGELRRDWTKGIQTIDTARTVAATGWIGGLRLALGPVIFEIETPNAAVVLSSLDGKPLAASKKILLTAVARAEADPARPGHFRAEPVRGKYRIRATGPLAQFALSSRSRARDAPADRVPDPGLVEGPWRTFELPSGLATHWAILQAQ